VSLCRIEEEIEGVEEAAERRPSGVRDVVVIANLARLVEAEDVSCATFDGRSEGGLGGGGCTDCELSIVTAASRTTLSRVDG
jgi:hypothetical protein